MDRLAGNAPALTKPALLLAFCAASLMVLLSGCGFYPLYGSLFENGAGESEPSLWGGIFIIPPRSAAAQELYEALQRQLALSARSRAAPMQLDFKFDIHNRDLFSGPDKEITRRRLVLQAEARLTGSADGVLLWQGETSTSISYALGASEYANLSTQAKARQQALETLARQIRLQLAVFFEARQNPRPEALIETEQAAQP